MVLVFYELLPLVVQNFQRQATLKNCKDEIELLKEQVQSLRQDLDALKESNLKNHDLSIPHY